MKTRARTTGPVRMCVICRRRFLQKELRRFTCPLSGEQGLQPDEAKKREGRGFYLCRDAVCQNKWERYTGWRKKCKGGGNDDKTESA